MPSRSSHSEFKWKQRIQNTKNKDSTSGYVVSPSYGRVLKANEDEISIFIPYKANHDLFAPIDGEIIKISSEHGKFRKQFFKAKKSILKTGKVKVDIAGEIPLSFSSFVGGIFRPDRIRIDVKKGEEIKQGEDIGEILLGSLSETYFPEDIKIKIIPLVRFMDKIEGGKTKIAQWIKY